MTITQLVRTYGTGYPQGADFEGVSLTQEQFMQCSDLALIQAYPTLESYQDAFPVGQNFHTGKWGFGRYADGLDLNTCRYPAKLSAEKVRDGVYTKAVARCANLEA